LRIEISGAVVKTLTQMVRPYIGSPVEAKHERQDLCYLTRI
jgi:hypothetical protein